MSSTYHPGHGTMSSLLTEVQRPETRGDFNLRQRATHLSSSHSILLLRASSYFAIVIPCTSTSRFRSADSLRCCSSDFAWWLSLPFFCKCVHNSPSLLCLYLLCSSLCCGCACSRRPIVVVACLARRPVTIAAVPDRSGLSGGWCVVLW